MADPDQLRDARNQLDRLGLAIDRLVHAAPASRKLLARVISRSSGTSPYYVLTNPAKVNGPMAEGLEAEVGYTTEAVVPVLMLGGNPDVGQLLIAKNYRGRWVARLPTTTGGAGCAEVGTIPSCSCSPLPPQLSMTSTAPACNFRMFQSCTLKFGPPPDGYTALDLGSNLYVSEESFPDPLANNSTFQYILTCHYNQFNLSRIYLTTPFGSPFRDGILYSWIINGGTNVCAPGQPNPAAQEWCRCVLAHPEYYQQSPAPDWSAGPCGAAPPYWVPGTGEFSLQAGTPYSGSDACGYGAVTISG